MANPNLKVTYHPLRILAIYLFAKDLYGKTYRNLSRFCSRSSCTLRGAYIIEVGDRWGLVLVPWAI